MATDIFDNEMGKMAIIDATEGEIIIGSSSAYCVNANISYQVPVTPVATFGKDAVFAKGHPQGNFMFGAIAGSNDFAGEVKGNGDCTYGSISVTFKKGMCTATGITKWDAAADIDRTVTLYGAFFSNFQIQGTANDTFFTENQGGIFHYLA